MPMAWRNIVAGAVLLAFSAGYAWLANALPERSLPNTPGPSFFPLVVIALVAVLSAALLVQGIAALRARDESIRPGKVSPVAALAIAAFLVYLALLPVAGFVVAGIAFFAALMFLYGSRRPLHIALASTILPVVLFAVFRYGFQIGLPRSVLGF